VGDPRNPASDSSYPKAPFTWRSVNAPLSEPLVVSLPCPWYGPPSWRRDALMRDPAFLLPLLSF